MFSDSANSFFFILSLTADGSDVAIDLSLYHYYEYVLSCLFDVPMVFRLSFSLGRMKEIRKKQS